jgi:hypothetical protein
VETRHAAVDGIGNLFKACTVPVIESSCSASTTPLASDTDEDMGVSAHNVDDSSVQSRVNTIDRKLGSGYEAVITEREFLSRQLQRVLTVLQDNLYDCLQSTFGPEKYEGTMPLHSGAFSSLIISIVRSVVCAYNSPFAKFVPVNTSSNPAGTGASSVHFVHDVGLTILSLVPSFSVYLFLFSYNRNLTQLHFNPLTS